MPEDRSVAALCRQARELEPRGEVVGSFEQPLELGHRGGFVLSATLTGRLLRERERRLDITRIELDGAGPVLDGFRQVAAPALRKAQHALDGATGRRKVRRFAQLLQRAVDLLLPNHQQPQIGPGGGFIGNDGRDALELLPCEYFLARLQCRQSRVEGRNGFAVHGVGHAQAAPAR